jgi:hypothetical protein
MAHISRGFRGKRAGDGDVSRLPPGQHVVEGFPMLSAGPTPYALSTSGRSPSPASFRAKDVRLGGFQIPSQRDDPNRHPLRDQVVEARHLLGGASMTPCSRTLSTTLRTCSRLLTAGTRPICRSLSKPRSLSLAVLTPRIGGRCWSPTDQGTVAAAEWRAGITSSMSPPWP